MRSYICNPYQLEQIPTGEKIYDLCRSENITSHYIDNITDVEHNYIAMPDHKPVLLISEHITLPKALGGMEGFAYDRSYHFPTSKKAVLSIEHWANISMFIGSGTFGYVLLAKISSFNFHTSSGQVALKVDHKKKFIVWEVTIHSRVKILYEHI